jgi:hypothetical protein
MNYAFSLYRERGKVRDKLYPSKEHYRYQILPTRTYFLIVHSAMNALMN